MSIMTIGSRLVRVFGEGENLRKVVTECVNGKTYTRVLDVQGNILKHRLKVIERTNVGNKKVSTIIKVNENVKSFIKTTYDRVYNSEGSLLGSRCTFEGKPNGYTHLEKVASTKQGTGISRQIKFFWKDNVIYKSMYKASPGSMHIKDSSSARVYYNQKGLPCPVGLDPHNNMSLKEMKDWHFANNPERYYAHPDLNLGFLDERGADNLMLNSLDKYI